MSHLVDIFGPGSNFKTRFIQDWKKLVETTNSIKALNLKVVLVCGAYDLTHIGHARYLEKAKQEGAVVVVGVDTDKAIQVRKGLRRPVVPESERLEMLTHLRHVDLVTLLKDFDKKGVGGYQLVSLVKPDVFVISKTNEYTKDQLTQLKKRCGRLVIFPPQAQTSTSAKIRLLTLDLVNDLKNALERLVNGI